MNEPSLKPTRKVGSGTAAGAVVVILVWVASRFAGVDVPADVAAAAAVLIGLGTAYWVKDRA